MAVNRGHLLALALLAMVVIAGCQSPVGTAEPPATDTATTTTTPDVPENPWNAETITIAVTADLQDRNYTALAKPAVEYWNEHRDAPGTTQFGDPPRLELTADTDAADVRLHYTPTIARCNGALANRETGFYHCTQAVEANTTVDDQLTVRVTSQFVDDATTDITVNALAGLYGVSDSDPPREISSPRLLDPFPRTDTVTVGLTYIANDDRNVTPLVQDAIDYWMEIDDEHGDYQTEWVVDPDAEHPDVVVLYVDTIVQCGFGPNHDYYIGCTNLLSTERSANTPVHVEIAAGYTDESTTNTIKHEWGHLYGREHGEEPMPLMSATGDAIPLNETNSTG